jgi:hypothetical protein
MNKAFVREPDQDDRVFCPKCGAVGVPVMDGPLDRYLRPAARPMFVHDAWFCPSATCDVAYFSEAGKTATTGDLARPVYPKDPDAPICACFGYAYDDAAADATEDSPRRTRELLTKAKSAAADCTNLAADGQSCVATVQSLYMKLKSNAPT